MEKKFRVPRKQKKKIPKDTYYCYKPTSGFIHEEGKMYFKIEPCEFLLYDVPKEYIDKEYGTDQQNLFVNYVNVLLMTKLNLVVKNIKNKNDNLSWLSFLFL